MITKEQIESDKESLIFDDPSGIGTLYIEHTERLQKENEDYRKVLKDSIAILDQWFYPYRNKTSGKAIETRSIIAAAKALLKSQEVKS